MKRIFGNKNIHIAFSKYHSVFTLNINFLSSSSIFVILILNVNIFHHVEHKTKRLNLVQHVGVSFYANIESTRKRQHGKAREWCMARMYKKRSLPRGPISEFSANEPGQYRPARSNCCSVITPARLYGASYMANAAVYLLQAREKY